MDPKHHYEKSKIPSEVEQEGFSSPTSNTTTEENRLLMEYIDRKNLFRISDYDESFGRVLKLRKFFKIRFNQQVEIYSGLKTTPTYTEGKVTAIGRDFVLITNLRKRIWMPYHSIHSANIPFGIPNYTNTHQNFMYDNQFKKKLLNRFGETVSKRDVFRQEFFQETLKTNLQFWKDTQVHVYLNTGKQTSGRVLEVTNETLTLKSFNYEETLQLSIIHYIEKGRILSLLQYFKRKFRSLLKLKW